MPRAGISGFPDVAFSDPRVKLADMNGDGLQDVVLIEGRAVQYWPSEGHGDWGARVWMQNAPTDLPHDADPRRLFLHDVDGDGLADLIYVEDGRVRLWMVVSLLFEIGFLVVRWFEQWRLNTHWDSSAYGSIVWVTLGTHTSHVVTDLADTGVLAALMFTAHTEPRRFVDVVENSRYWYFVILFWIPVYLIIYWAPRWL